MSWERDLNNGKDRKREERRRQKDKKKKQAWDDEAETYGFHNPRKEAEKTRQELKMELYQEENFDSF